MGDRREDVSAGTRLLVRANQLDLGQRPVSPSWQSPDIYSHAGPITDVVEGVPVQLAALVTNVGTDPALGVHVDFWWADSGLGLSKAASKHIGKSAIKTVSAGASVEFLCDVPWVPEAVSSGAHPCLVVEAVGVNRPVQYSFRPDLDSQVAQRNVTVVAPSGLRRMIFRAFNPFSERAATSVFAMTYRLDGERARDLPQAMLLETGLPEVQAMLRDQHIGVDEMRSAEFLEVIEVGEPERSDGERGEGTNDRHEGARTDRGRGEPLHQFDLPGRASAALVIERREGSSDHGVLVHQFVQVSDGFDVGGYTIVEM